MVAERPEEFPKKEDINTTPRVWSIPPHPRRDAAGHVIPRHKGEFRWYVTGGGGAVPGTPQTAVGVERNYDGRVRR